VRPVRPSRRKFSTGRQRQVKDPEDTVLHLRRTSVGEAHRPVSMRSPGQSWTLPAASVGAPCLNYSFGFFAAAS